MVHSVLVPKVVYQEIKKIHPEDKDKESNVYELDILGNSVAVVLGEPKYEFSNKGIVYFYIYTVKKSKICSVIGVFECDVNKIASLYADGDINIDELSDPILFSNVTEKTLRRKGCSAEPFKKSKQLSEENMKDLMEEITGGEDKKEKETAGKAVDDEEDEIFSLKLSEDAKRTKEKRESAETEANDIFQVDKNYKESYLPEESEMDAKRLKKEFKSTSSTQWIEKYMKNNNYKLLENEGGGDCLFACIRDAMKSIGKHTTIDKLRSVVADQLTEEIFNEQREVFLQFETEIKETEKEIEDLKRKNVNLKKRASGTSEPNESAHILRQAKELLAQHKKLAEHLKDTKNLQMESTGEMNNIDTMEKMRSYIRTSSYWAEEWAISALEEALQIKIVILSETNYEDGAKDNVLTCGIESEKTKKKGTFNPENYILVSLGNMHYQLISYKDKKIFTFKEVPYDIKILILNKCLEHNSGSYYLIQDFRNLKSRYGIDPNEGVPDEYDEQQGNLFDSDVQFIIGQSAPKSAKPGKTTGEKISVAKISMFVELGKSKEWRRKLDDCWMGEAIIIDNHKWASVKHYTEGAKYKKTYPDIYLQFSLDSESKLSKDIKMAIENKGISSPDKSKSTGDEEEPTTPKPDGDYYLGREEEEREVALHAKFSQHEELRIILKNTHNALLLKKKKTGEPASPDYTLMKIRKEI